MTNRVYRRSFVPYNGRIIHFNRENRSIGKCTYNGDPWRESVLFFRMISQPIKLVDDRQEGAWAQFVAWLVVDNSKIYVRVGGEGDLVANRSGAELKGGREKKKNRRQPKISFEFIPPFLPLVRPLLNFPSIGRNCSRVARIETFKLGEMFRWPPDRNINRIGF